MASGARCGVFEQRHVPLQIESSECNRNRCPGLNGFEIPAPVPLKNPDDRCVLLTVLIDPVKKLGELLVMVGHEELLNMVENDQAAAS